MPASLRGWLDLRPCRLVNRPHSIAFFAPLVCAAHCVATPVLVVVAPMLAPTPRLEWAFFAVSVALVSGAMLQASGVSGRMPRAWIPIMLGLGIWAGSLASWFEPVPEAVSTVIGAMMVSAALLWNARCALPPPRPHTSVRQAPL